MHKGITAALAFGTALAFVGHAAAQDPAWCKSKYGPNDEIGAANMLTPEMAAAAAKLVTKGKVYALGVPTSSTTPAFAPRTWGLVVLQPNQVGGIGLGATKTTYNDDIYMGWVAVGSQIDGLGHIGIDNVYYNCAKNSEFVLPTGLKKYGIDKVPNVVTRGVVLDMVGLLGKDPVPEGTAFNRKEIDDAAKKQGVEIRKGDVVLFHTGWQKLADSDPKRFLAGEPGLGKEGAEYLASKEVVAIGADTWALEVLPFEKGVGVFEIHQILLPKNGIYILENMETKDLVRDQAWEFMFVLGQPKVVGAVQGLINPTAIR